MSVPILLQGEIRGTRTFLLAGESSDAVFAGRSRWITLLSEVLPRALIAELALSRMLVGASGAGQFLLFLPEEARDRANEFLRGARAGIEELSGGRLTLAWGSTENLGDWTIVRKRLQEELARERNAPLARVNGDITAARTSETGTEGDSYFESDMGAALLHAPRVGWSPDAPARVVLQGGKHFWPVGASGDALPMARHAALTDDGDGPASPLALGARAEGRPVFGMLLGDVDDFGVRLRRAQSIEEHVQLSVLYKQFFAGELEMLCSMPEFWRKVTLLYSGGDDFAVYGAWDALLGLARELQRLFARFSEAHLQQFPGPEGKTISMALALASSSETPLSMLYEQAGRELRTAKGSGKDRFWLLGRTLEWKHLSEASDLKDALTRMITEWGVPVEYLRELGGIYRESRRSSGSRKIERPWRFHRRITRILGTGRGRDFSKARGALIRDLAGQNPGNLKLRPSGRVGLEWARLLAPVESESTERA